MKTNSTSWLTALVSVVVGVILIALHGHDGLLNWVVEAIGALVALVGLCVALAQIFQHKMDRNDLYLVAGVVAFGLGLWLVFDSEFFVSFVIYVLALVLILAGAWHMFTLRVFNKTYHVPLWLWVIPAILIVGGLAVLFIGVRVTAGAIVLICGIGLILSAVGSFTETVSKMRNRHDEQPSQAVKKA